MLDRLRVSIGIVAATAAIGFGAAHAQVAGDVNGSAGAGAGSGSAPAPAAPAAPTAPAVPAAPTAAPTAPPTAGAPAVPTAPTAPTPGMPDASASAGAGLGVSTGAPATPAGPKPPENPDEKGKFTAGGQLRFPNGPDTTGKYATLNWVAVDAKGRYNPTDWLATYINMPIALKKSSLPAGMATTGGPDIFGGITARSEAGYSKTLGIQLTLGFMRGGLGENSFMYSEKMFPYYQGGLQFVTSAGPYFRFKALGLNITTTPSVAFAAGGSSQGGGTALQVPLSAVIKVGSLVELAADTGIFTAPGLSFDANKGAQMYTGGSLTVKIFKIVVHAGAGVASLFTGPMAPYSSIGQSVYFDLNVKYAK